MNVNVRTFAFNHCPSLLKPTLNGIAWSPLRLRLAKGVFWSIAGTIISRGLTLFATIAIARFLGRSSYGELGIVQSTVGMLGVFAGMGLGLTSTKYVAEFRCRAPQRAGQAAADDRGASAPVRRARWRYLVRPAVVGRSAARLVDRIGLLRRR